MTWEGLNMANKKRKWIVKVPITLTLCAEVTAPNKAAAIEAANCKCSEIMPQYVGYRSRIDRPTIASLLADEDDQTVWWDPYSIDICEIFLTDKAVPTPL